MSNQQPERGPMNDPLDDLLSAAFEQALLRSDNPSVLEDVMAGIARRERQRTLVIGLLGAVALVLAALGALPLIGLVESLFADLLDALALPAPAAVSGLPLLALLLAAGVGWLFLEEAF